MRLAVSNIAWAPEETARAYALLAARGVAGLEIAPGLFLADHPDPMRATLEEAAPAVARAARHGLRLASMQSLLFGVEAAALFGPEAGRQALEAGMGRAIALAGRLGVPVLVFGSPKNRVIPEGMGAEAARDIWLPAFRRIGAAAAAAGARVALEPNPEAYGTNFMTGLAETVAVAGAVDHPGIALNLDLGALILTGEIDRIGGDLPAILPRVAHVHLSAPHLEPLATRRGEVARFLAALAAAGWDGWVSVEMRGGLPALRDALDAVQEAMR